MMHRHYVDGPWGQIHVRSSAGGRTRPPLLLLHPTPKSGWIFETLAGTLGDGRVVIAPDTPGYGASDAPPFPVGIDDYARAMLHLLERLKADGVVPSGQVDVLGYHTGSATAVALAHIAPSLVRRLVLVSLPAYTQDVRSEKLDRLAQWPAATADGAQLRSMWKVMQDLFDPRVSPAWRHESYAENLRCGARAWWGYAAVYRYDLQAALDRLAQRTLVLNPQDDLWIPTRENAHRIADGAYVELPGMAHGLFELEPLRIAKLVNAFLDENSGTRSS